MTDAKSRLGYSTALGEAWIGDALELLAELDDDSVDLVVTSPPFALQRKKEYGNKDQGEYLAWLSEFARVVFTKLKSTGSFVVDLGGSYEKGTPVRSLYNFRIPIEFCDNLGFHLAQDFYWHNPSKLPSPIEWVNKRKIRVKDSVNTVWWFSKSPWPKADVRNVLVPYSGRMLRLLKDPDSFFKPKLRPSGHDIGKSFATDNGGAIPSNLLQVAHSESNSLYLRGCKSIGLKAHPARFPAKVPEFFVKLLTEPGDLVVDIFSGSNTTGEVAEKLGRRWRSFEIDPNYVAASSFRFLPDSATSDFIRLTHGMISAGHPTHLGPLLDAAE